MKNFAIWLSTIIGFALIVSVIAFCKVGAINTIPSPSNNISRLTSPLAVSELKITEDGFLAFMQVCNNEKSIVNLNGWVINIESNTNSVIHEYTLPNGWLESGKCIVLSDGESVKGEVVKNFGRDIYKLNPDDKIILFNKNDNYYNKEVVSLINLQFGFRYRKSTSKNKDPVYTKIKNQEEDLVADEVYFPLDKFELSPIEVLSRAKDCSPLQNEIECGDYIKFYNNTNNPIDFSGVRLRTGKKSAAIPLGGIINPHEYVVFNIDSNGDNLELINSGSFVWLEDINGVKTYENTLIEYPDNGSRKGISWALGADGKWNWATPNPYGENKIIPLQENSLKPDSSNIIKSCPPGQELNLLTNRCRKIQDKSELDSCPAGQERNPDTGRCRKINLSTNSNKELKPCAPDEYRHPETNRCRKLVSAASATKSLTPCKPGEERNPITNRCRKIASSTSKDVKPCPAGQERNPLTNRCRKIQTGSLGDKNKFAVEDVAASKDTIAAWWAVGGIGISALGYAGWEWRREIGEILYKIKNIISGGK